MFNLDRTEPEDLWLGCGLKNRRIPVLDAVASKRRRLSSHWLTRNLHPPVLRAFMAFRESMLNAEQSSAVGTFERKINVDSASFTFHGDPL